MLKILLVKYEIIANKNVINLNKIIVSILIKNLLFFIISNY
jgi:hypothetical protein